jgi:putative endonuclease
MKLMDKTYYIYLLTNFKNSVIYTGVTSDLVKRVWEHKESKYPQSFTSKYKTNKLVYYESCNDPITAITREKQIKGGSREDKLNLIRNFNPEFKDLYPLIIS